MRFESSGRMLALSFNWTRGAAGVRAEASGRCYHRAMLSRPFAPATLYGLRLGRTVLLWLAVAMALAQVVAIRHAYSHPPGESSRQSGGKHPGGLAQCEACIAAVALGTAAPPPVPLLFAPLAQQLPQLLAPTDQTVAPQLRPYAIRAPPASSS